VRRPGADTDVRHGYGGGVRSALLLVCCFALALVAANVARADDGDPRFHRTTPRGALDQTGGMLLIGIPGGRAWGIESELRPLPPPGTTLIVRLGVTDGAVREAFVRVAYYAAASGRSRQLALSDSPAVAAGKRATVAVAVDPPPAAVSYRVRVLARLVDATGRSADDAVTAVLRVARGAVRPIGSFASRLLE
jgi:hypothetical protein